MTANKEQVMAYVPEYDDPFAGGEKVPSLSWKDLPVGSTFTLEILEAAKSLQSTNFESGQPDYWDEEKTRPKMAAVINVRVLGGPHSVGEDRSIWAQIPSNMFIAIKEAQKAADARIAPGGTLHLRFTGTKPHENKRYSPIKQYEAKYVAPTGSTAPDPFTQPQDATATTTAPQVPGQRWNIPATATATATAAPARTGWKR
jgi:hypothetical protein